MRVSFIIPLFNCLPLTQAMLASLRATLPAGLAHEIIFIDDGSTDGTRDWLRTLSADPAIRVLLNDRNLGYAASNNRAAALATGQLLVLLNNDLVLTPRWLEPLLAAHAASSRAASAAHAHPARATTAHSAAPAIIGNIQLNAATGAIDHAGIFINAKLKPQHDTLVPHAYRLWPFSRANALRPVPATTGACLSIPRALWQQLGGFDEAFVNGCEDVDLCFRARAAGHSTYVALNSVIRHHVSSSPGRKLRDEQNTHRLTHRWRDELARLAARAWCRDFLTRDLNAATAFAAPLDALAIAAFATHLTSAPPLATTRGVDAALHREFQRWETLGVVPSN